MRLVPGAIVDVMPNAWWRPGNFRLVAGRSPHFCLSDNVRVIEVDGKTIGKGRKPFRYGTASGEQPLEP